MTETPMFTHRARAMVTKTAFVVRSMVGTVFTSKKQIGKMENCFGEAPYAGQRRTAGADP